MKQLEFEYNKEKLATIANEILDIAKNQGATEAQIELSENISKGVDVLHSKTENFATSYDAQLVLSVFIGKNKGNVGITTIKPTNLPQIVAHAIDIAKYTQADAANGIADKEHLCQQIHTDLGLYNPCIINNQDLINKAINIEEIALKYDSQITNSDGASISLSNYNFLMANSNGFCNGYQTTRYGASVSILGGKNNDEMQTDYWHTSSRDFSTLLSNEKLAQKAAQRLLRRLNKGTIQSGKYSVIFESPIAKSLIASYLNAVSGGSLYRKLSFLTNSLDTQVFPEWFNMYEDPFKQNGLSSCYFDNEGINVTPRNLVTNGVVNGYLLSSYTARKLKMQPTGHAGGSHNIAVSSNFDGDLSALAKQMGTGLIIIETIGNGVNLVTGDYSVGASGLWVDSGNIQHFVDNITIAGNLREMFKQIKLIGSDSEISSLSCGSMLIDGVTIST